MIPRHADPGYMAGDGAKEDPLAAALKDTRNYRFIRAFPLAAGGAVTFTHRTLHWGSTAAPAAADGAGGAGGAEGAEGAERAGKEQPEHAGVGAGAGAGAGRPQPEPVVPPRCSLAVACSNFDFEPPRLLRGPELLARPGGVCQVPLAVRLALAGAQVRGRLLVVSG
jgi:hypothetical protein